MEAPQKKIWLVSELYYPEETSTGYFLTKIAEGLAEHNPVNVLCSQPTYSGRGSRAPLKETHKRVNIHRCWSTVFDKDFFPARIINLFTITLSIFIASLKQFKKDNLVFVVTNPPLLPFVVFIACAVRKSKSCLIIHDVYPEVLAATKLADSDSFLFKAIGGLTRYLYKRMSVIVVLGRDMAVLVQKKLNSRHPPVQIIHNWGDVDFVKPIKREAHPLLEDLGISKKFVIQYSGNIGRTHGIAQILSCAEHFLNNPLFHFIFIGFGGKKNWLAREISRRSLSNVIQMDYRPRSELPMYLTACDIGIISFVKGMVGVSVPSRMYNVMAAGKPIVAIAEADSELACVVSEEKIGWVVSPGDTDGLNKVIREAQGDRDQLEKMGQRARSIAESKYSFYQVRELYRALADSILEKGV